MSELLQLRPDVLDGLTVLVGVGLFQNRDDDAVALLEALRPARSRSVELRFYDAWLAMRREQFSEAVQLLNALHDDGAGSKTWLCRALLAATLFAVGDASWRSHADAVAEDGSDKLASTLARQLRGERAEPGELHHSDSSRTAIDGAASMSALPAETSAPLVRPVSYMRA